MPQGWARPGTVKNVKTRQDLLNRRQRESVPHQTFDLDGDGQVSQRDYFLAKQFDKDKDGKLNSDELA